MEVSHSTLSLRFFFLEKFLGEDSQYPDYEFKKLSPYNDFPGLTEFLAHWAIID